MTRSTPARRTRALSVLAALALVAAMLAFTAAPAGAARGRNNTNAKLCQKGGWTWHTTESGDFFASEEECTSYAASTGGELRATECWAAKVVNADARMTGPIDTLNNLTAYPSTDGTCTGTPYENRLTVIQAASDVEADGKCPGLLAGSVPFPLARWWEEAPASYYACVVAP